MAQDDGIMLPVRGLDELCVALDYLPEDPTLLAQACAHRSWCAETPGTESNERLEFLGDSILGFLVAERVFRNHGHLDEGALTDIRKAVVNAVCLAEVAAEIGLGNHVLLGKGETASGGREKPSILADAMEAVLAAVYLDGGMQAARELIDLLLGSRIEAAVASGGRSQDNKSRLQELLAQAGRPAPKYRFEATGPDHARIFAVEVIVGDDVLGVGGGRSKKQAEQQAARNAVDSLDQQHAPDAGADNRGADHG